MDEEIKPTHPKKKKSAPAAKQTDEPVLRQMLERLEARANNSEYLLQLLQKALADQERIEKSYRSLVERKDSQIETAAVTLAEAERQVEKLQSEIKAERLDKLGLQKLIDDSLAQLGDLEKRQHELQGAWTEFVAERKRIAEEAPRLESLQKSLAVAEEKLVFTRNELANLAARFSQKLQKIAELEDGYAALSRELAQEKSEHAREQDEFAQERSEHAREKDEAAQEKNRLEQRVAQLAKTILFEQKNVAQRSRELAAIHSSVLWRLLTKLSDVKRQVARFTPALLSERPKNPLFDAAYYLDENPDVRTSGVDPYVHYLRKGILEGRNPHPLFDTDWYLERNPDVLRSGVDPLLHYYQFGAAEGRDPHPMFDTDWYLERYPDARSSGINPLQHYCQQGAAENRDPNPQFSVAAYLERYPELRGQGIDVLKHFMRHAAAPLK